MIEFLLIVLIIILCPITIIHILVIAWFIVFLTVFTLSGVIGGGVIFGVLFWIGIEQITNICISSFFGLFLGLVTLSYFIEYLDRSEEEKLELIHNKDIKSQIALDKRISIIIQRNAHLLKIGKFGEVSKDNSIFLKRTGIAILIFIAILIKLESWFLV